VEKEINQAHNSTPRAGVSPDTDEDHIDTLSENKDNEHAGFLRQDVGGTAIADGLN